MAFKSRKDAGNVEMVTEILLEKLHIRSRLWKLMAGSILTALMFSLGIMGILKLMGISINPGVPVVIAVAGTAAYAARFGQIMDKPAIIFCLSAEARRRGGIPWKKSKGFRYSMRSSRSNVNST